MPANLDHDAVMFLDWYHALPSRRINLFDDFAGNELFLIEFDSLLLRCFSASQIDFGNGFQLLHAVFVVEKLLSDLVRRKSRFQIICFHQHELLCIPATAKDDEIPKFRLARAVIMRHILVNVSVCCAIEFHRFESLHDEQFPRFLAATDAYFVMIHDGAGAKNFRPRDPIIPKVMTTTRDAEPALRPDYEAPFSAMKNSFWLRAMIAFFLMNEFNVALINEMQFLDSKVFTHILQYADLKVLSVPIPELSSGANLQQPPPPPPPTYVMPQALEAYGIFSEADLVTLQALQSLVATNQISKHHASLFLLHTAALSILPLQHRYFPTFRNTEHFKNTIDAFTESALSILSNSAYANRVNTSDIPCNLVDLVDGRLLATIIADHEFRSGLLSEESIKQKFDSLCVTFLQIAGVSLSLEAELYNSPKLNTIATERLVSDSVMLSFQNSAFEAHFDPIQMSIVSDSIVPMFSCNQVSKALSYGHGQKNAFAAKGSYVQQELQAKRDAITQDQNVQKEIQEYAASLTNAYGKILEPQIIVAGSTRQDRKTATHKPVKQKKSSEASRQGNDPGNPNKKGGRAAALEAAAQLRATATKPKSDIKANLWNVKCREILKENDVSVRYKLSMRYLQSLGKNDELGPEIQLFTVNCLLRVIVSEEACVDKSSITAIIWDHVHRLSHAISGITPEVAAALEHVIKAFGFSGIDVKINAASRPLSFACLHPKTLQKHQLSFPGSSIEFQLEHCGPYLDRAIDSTPDPRVRFEPDGWQRHVLDAIDEGNSLFVTAPTSAGKTFISFYAMEKVLRADDDGVLVYVAPTTALVNQIAAEIHGRFSKNYKHAGRSVWAIHTTGYSINNSTGCQILVTVPHMLQNMLLAPAHAEKENSWSTRIRRIIFDEIHCIGQAEDGMIWEQLILQSPCPIIALSATVGNPKELSDWLSSTERANGNELVTVHYHYRYSNLRNYIYLPPKEFCFSGLPALPDIYIPGLDESDAFHFVHPVSGLVEKEKGMPSDFNLEPRDCLRLWRVMSQHATGKHYVAHSLHPDQFLPELVKKIDVINWETQLKVMLRQWMLDDGSPFERLRQDLSGKLQYVMARDTLNTKAGCSNDCINMKIDPNSLSTMMLPVLVDLHAKDAMPCLIFNYDCNMCETLAHSILDELGKKENAWKASKPSWQKKMADFDQYKKELEIARARADKASRIVPKKKAKRGEADDVEKISRAERIREQANADICALANFNPDAPIDGFHFADVTKLATSELDEFQSSLRGCNVPEWLVRGLERGVGVHHSGMNRRYLQVVEVLFRRGFLRVVLATGTLALGINMPCRTVIFAGDSISLTALNFRQAAGRAGRRGFDVLGNVVFVGIPKVKVLRLLSSRLPDLTTRYPINTSLILRQAILLHGSNNSPFALQAIKSIFLRPHLYLRLLESKMVVKHHLRFSIEYLRRQSLLNVNGAPINFAECVSTLDYTGNSVWAFHALLSRGYFHKVCKDIEVNPERVMLTLMLVMSSIFERQTCKRSDIEFIDDALKHSSSVVFLPSLPDDAKEALSTYNAETLSVFKIYAKTFIEQYLHHKVDELPLTRYRVGSEVMLGLPSTLPPVIRSPFVALSGHGDEFSTISELCNTVRSGIPLEEAIVPYLQLSLEASDPPLNAYLLDFFNNGDLQTIERMNKIHASEIQSRLNDFCTILRTIVVGLGRMARLMPAPGQDQAQGGIQGFRAQRNRKILGRQKETKIVRGTDENHSRPSADKPRKENTPGDDEDEDDDDDDNWYYGVRGLVRVVEAFDQLHAQFEGKLKKVAV
ncbi:hypothetical protein BKA67DRAFT_583616 [Truncatella angustata]|uniref:Uncharacterized protein n=1 Tax=Truncatella angustata TaxID=152316 RepID=A0A9P8U9F2_9PEZI|nr:uncharacterized protein BKA67DRAFT_583616 [Truncatella angustata]KAH6646234.1 hypothetical protein BKA67DRAFT_583616 [Truncatella angustata]